MLNWYISSRYISMIDCSQNDRIATKVNTPLIAKKDSTFVGVVLEKSYPMTHCVDFKNFAHQWIRVHSLKRAAHTKLYKLPRLLKFIDRRKRT